MENAHLALEQAKEELTYLYTFFARAYILYNKYKDLSKKEGSGLTVSMTVSRRSFVLSLSSKKEIGRDKSQFFLCALLYSCAESWLPVRLSLKRPKSVSNHLHGVKNEKKHDFSHFFR